ncbi:MAG TPA: hypothetical protein PK784_05490 [Tenuifilaceae bacterium]|nr:hypothetical protein [Tenuifilaceae bacterium]HPN21581.1 hypothetical protein [Tenuifilaceae bacterium]
MKTKKINFSYEVPMCSVYGSIENNMALSIPENFIGYTYSCQRIGENSIQQRLCKEGLDAVIEYTFSDTTLISIQVSGTPRDAVKLSEKLESLLNYLIEEMWYYE